VDEDAEGSRKIVSNEGREATRAERRRRTKRQSRDVAIANANVGDYIEQSFPTVSGKKWFRGVLAKRIVGAGSVSHGIYQVRWLENGDLSTIDISSPDVTLLGPLEKPPGAIRTRTESRNLENELRGAENPALIERKIRQKQRQKKPLSTASPGSSERDDKAGGMTKLTIVPENILLGADQYGQPHGIPHRDIVEESVLLEMPLDFYGADGPGDTQHDDSDLGPTEPASSCIENPEIARGLVLRAFEQESNAACIIQTWYRLSRLGRLRRRHLLLKWKPWITNELPVILAASELRTAEIHVKRASQHMGDRRYPLSTLLSDAQARDLEKYNPSYVERVNRSAISTTSAAMLLKDRNSLYNALGHEQRAGHQQHMVARRQLERERADDERLAIDPIPASQHKRDTERTPILIADQNMLHRMAAPNGATLDSEGAFGTRRVGITAIMANLRRLYSNKNDVYPVLDSVGKILSIYVPERVQTEIAENYPISTKKEAGHLHILNSIKQQEALLKRKQQQLREDRDVHALQYISDNVGFGKRVRFETITHYFQVLRYSNLPPRVIKWLEDLGERKKEWLLMEKSGFCEPRDLLASPESDQLQRLQV